MKKVANTMMRSFFIRHGIVQNWVVLQLDTSDGNFRYFCGEHGFPEDIAEQLTHLIRKVGKKLAKFRFSSNNLADFDFLKDECGIMHKHLGEQLGIRVSGSLTWKLQQGLSPAEKEILLASLRETAVACQHFELPENSIRRKKAA